MRTVVFDSHVTKEVYQLFGGAVMADKAMEALEWTLSRDPSQGEEMGSGFWAVEWRGLEFVYDFSETEVCIQGVRKLAPE